MTNSKKIQYWKNLIDDQILSGLPVYQWCRQHSINTSNFYQWRKKIYPTKDNTTFKEVSILPSTSSDICITINGVSLHFDKSLLPDIIGAFK